MRLCVCVCFRQYGPKAFAVQPRPSRRLLLLSLGCQLAIGSCAHFFPAIVVLLRCAYDDTQRHLWMRVRRHSKASVDLLLVRYALDPFWVGSFM